MHEITGIAVTLIALAAPWAIVGLGWLLAKASTALTTSTASKAQLIVARIAHFAELVVRGQQPAVDMLKKMSSSGKLSKDDIENVMKESLSDLKKVAGDDALDEMQAVLKIAAPGIDVYLRGMLESELAKSKVPAALAPTSPL